jgi:hypothetical protein
LLRLTFSTSSFYNPAYAGMRLFCFYHERFDLWASRLYFCGHLTKAESTAKPGQKTWETFSSVKQPVSQESSEVTKEAGIWWDAFHRSRPTSEDLVTRANETKEDRVAVQKSIGWFTDKLSNQSPVQTSSFGLLSLRLLLRNFCFAGHGTKAAGLSVMRSTKNQRAQRA